MAVGVHFCCIIFLPFPIFIHFLLIYKITGGGGSLSLSEALTLFGDRKTRRRLTVNNFGERIKYVSTLFFCFMGGGEG